MSKTPHSESGTDTGTDGASKNVTKSAAKSAADTNTHLRFRNLEDRHMPKDFSISLEHYRRGGTEAFLREEATHVATQSMRGFEPRFKNIVDYIVRITHEIWEEKNIGYIYDTYSHDCRVWDDVGLQYGRDKIVADTVHTCNAMPDIRLVADEVIWAGDDATGFHTSHRTMILGTNTGFSRFGPPTHSSIRLFCIANCIARDNEISDEHVAYDTAGLVRQMGLNVVDTAKEIAKRVAKTPEVANFDASEPDRLYGQNIPQKPAYGPLQDGDVRAFANALIANVWNRRNFGAMDDLYASNVVFEGSTGRLYRGVGQLRSHVMSMVAMFPNLSLSVNDIYWMGNEEDGYLVALRWGGIGAHRGYGPYGSPTGKETHIWGLTQWQIKDGVIQKEWTNFNEFGILMQLFGDQ